MRGSEKGEKVREKKILWPLLCNQFTFGRIFGMKFVLSLLFLSLSLSSFFLSLSSFFLSLSEGGRTTRMKMMMIPVRYFSYTSFLAPLRERERKREKKGREKERERREEKRKGKKERKEAIKVNVLVSQR